MKFSVPGNGVVYYKINNRNYIKYTKSIKITKTSTISVYGKDILGHDSEVSTVTYIIDKVSPTVVSTTLKKNHEKSIKYITIEYSEKTFKVDKNKLKKIILRNKKNDHEVAISIKLKNNKIIITPKSKLKTKTRYKLIITKNILKDLIGNTNKAYTLSFKT
ncbi:Ig-like domain-containing protein [Methanobrevibacter filiformis]|uniref:Ig-like domain-containing protein n=1 Tax=Methanobrevibacter filiformis TaxID=55758 RepID=UPI00082A2651|nr:Ig-like domain-containing protein [Methanobrevibacter filiformis]